MNYCFLKNLLFVAIGCFLLFSCGNKKNVSDQSSTDSVKTYNPVDILTKKINADPKNADLYFERSKWYLNQKMMSSAESDIKKALSIDSSKADYYLHYADLSFAGLQFEQCEELFKKAVSLDPGNVNGHLKLAELYLYLKRYKESLENANEVLKIDKHLAKAYFIKGFVYKENRDTANAISSFQTCVEQQKDYYDAFIQLGNLFAERKNLLAEQYYNQALKLRARSTEAYYDRGLYYQNTGQIEKATADYNELIKIDPGYSNAYFNLGYIEVNHNKNYRTAIEYFTKAINTGKYYVEAFYNRGYCYEQLGDKKKAMADYREALAVFPTYKLAKEGMKRIGS